MKILQLIYSLTSGGAEKFVVDLSNQLAEDGHDVTLCILRKPINEKLLFNKQFLSDKVKFHSIMLDRGFSLIKCYKVEKYIKESNPDILHCHLNVLPYIFRIALMNNSPVIFHTLHSIAFGNAGRGIQYYLNRFFYKKNKINPICISRICQESYENYYKLNNAPIIENGRSLVANSPQIKKVEQEISLYKSSKDTIVFVHVARFNEAKNQQLLIDAFNRLNEEGVDFILLVIGAGFDCVNGDKLKMGACDKIFFLGEKNNVNDYLRLSNAFCLTSVYEGLPISLLEALSCGVTPICTPVGGIPDVIVDGVNGYLSLGLAVEEYCEAIKRYINKPLLPQTLIDFYKENYSMESCAKRYENLFINAI